MSMKNNLKEYFALLKPKNVHGRIIKNKYSYGYDNIYLSEFEGKLLDKTYTRNSPNVRCKFELSDKIIYVHHVYLEQNTQHLKINNNYKITVNEDNPRCIQIKEYLDKWDMYLPIGTKLDNITRNKDTFLVYLYNETEKESKYYGTFYTLDSAILFRDYCINRLWHEKLITNSNIGKKRTKDINKILNQTYTNKNELYEELDEYFVLNIEENLQDEIIDDEKDVYAKINKIIPAIKKTIKNGIADENMTIKEYLNIIRAINITKNE